MSQHFGERLLKLRGARSQTEFCRLLGIASQQTYANYEKGRVPKPEILQRIAQRTGCSIEWLLTGSEPEIPEVMREEAARYGAAFGTQRVKPVSDLDSATLFDLMEGMPHSIATAVNERVKFRLVAEEEDAARTLRNRLLPTTTTKPKS